MRKIVSLFFCLIALGACTRDQLQDTIGLTLRNVCAQRDQNCTVDCGVGKTADGLGSRRKE